MTLRERIEHYEPTLRDERLASFLDRQGFERPLLTVKAIRVVDITPASALALIEKESGRGRNVFGHDRTIFAGAGKVTRLKYLAYKARRRLSGNRLMQGVGPCQLTWWEFQDEADREGGCWRPTVNTAVGLRRLKANINAQSSLREGARAYNGTGTAAEAYADDFMEKRRTWHLRLRGAGVS